MKILPIEHCNHCRYFENNMYHSICCWNPKVVRKCKEGKLPKKIQGYLETGIVIPKWCPLDDSI